MKLDQATLAKRIGVSRKWVIDAERGNPGAAIGTVLRALDAVGVHLAIAVVSAVPPSPPSPPPPPTVDLDQIVNATRKQERSPGRKR